MPPPLRRFAASAPPEAIVAAIREDGGCIVEKMFDASTIAAMRDAVLEKARTSADGVPGSATFGYSTAAETRTEAAQEAGTSYVGENTIRFSSLGKIAPAPFFRMLDNPAYKAVCDAMLLPYCGTYWVNTAQAMLIGPNSPAQPLHTGRYLPCSGCSPLRVLPKPHKASAAAQTRASGRRSATGSRRRTRKRRS